MTSDSQSGLYNASIANRIVRVSQGDILSVYVISNHQNTAIIGYCSGMINLRIPLLKATVI